MKTPSLIATLFAICTILSCSKKSDSIPLVNQGATPNEEFVVDSTSRINATGSATKVDLVKLVMLAYHLISIDDFDLLSNEASFVNDLGFSYLDMWDFILAIEEVFHLEIPDEDREKINTIGDMARYIEEHIVPSTPDVKVGDLFPPGTPGYPPGFGGEEEGECKYNEIASSAAKRSEKMSVEICGTGPNSRTKCYYWKIYSISSGMIPMYFVSKEQGVQSNRGSNVWQFDSFEHKEITKAGVEILYSASINNVVPTSSLKKSGLITYNDMAQMHLSFTASASAICDGLPFVFNDPTSTQQTWNASE